MHSPTQLTSRASLAVWVRLGERGGRMEEGSKWMSEWSRCCQSQSQKGRTERIEEKRDWFVICVNFSNEQDSLEVCVWEFIKFQICVNSFSIVDADHNPLGTGVYLAGSVFDHSCRPNAFVTFSGPTLTCRALQAFEDFDISKVGWWW